MSLHMIAVHKVNKEIMGYRLYDTEWMTYKDVKKSSVYELLESGVEINNLEIGDNGDVSEITGRINKYTTTEKGKIISNLAYVVIAKHEKESYTEYVVVNYWGKEEKITDAMLERYNSKVEIANIDIHNEEYEEIIEVKVEKDTREAVEELNNRLKIIDDTKIKIDSDGKVSLNYSNVKNMFDGKLDIPKGAKVIKERGFKNSNITEIVIPSTVEEIGNEAFMDCKKLEKVVLCNGLLEIKPNAFRGCRKLKNIEIPSTVKSIEEYAFRASGLKEVKLNSRKTKVELTSFDRNVRKRY